MRARQPPAAGACAVAAAGAPVVAPAAGFANLPFHLPLRSSAVPVAPAAAAVCSRPAKAPARSPQARASEDKDTAARIATVITPAWKRFERDEGVVMARLLKMRFLLSSVRLYRAAADYPARFLKWRCRAKNFL